jgi:hypothetical protein
MSVRSAVTTLARQAAPKQVRRAFLAEDYDGIAQYVNVSLSLGSSSSAIARVAVSGSYRVPLESGAEITVTVQKGTVEVVGLGS